MQNLDTLIVEVSEITGNTYTYCISDCNNFNYVIHKNDTSTYVGTYSECVAYLNSEVLG